jgi:hypothetical protein
MEFNIAVSIISGFIGYTFGNILSNSQIKALRVELKTEIDKGFKRLEDAAAEQAEKHHKLELDLKDYVHRTEFASHKGKCDQTFKELGKLR